MGGTGRSRRANWNQNIIWKSTFNRRIIEKKMKGAIMPKHYISACYMCVCIHKVSIYMFCLFIINNLNT